jgi:hypothetical protein
MTPSSDMTTPQPVSALMQANDGKRDGPMKIATRIAAAGLLSAALVYPCAAQERDHRRGYEQHHGWHGDIHRFHQHDLPLWRSGRWYHGHYNGRTGWWWITSGVWYYYPAPVYPYPDPFLPPGVAFPAAPVASAAQQYWYHCNSPAGYYPYIAHCRTPWRAVVAAAPQVAVPLPAPSAPVPPAPPQSAPVPPASAPAPAPAEQYWYYCAEPAGYYPTVPECRAGWQRVPAGAPPR